MGDTEIVVLWPYCEAMVGGSITSGWRGSGDRRHVPEYIRSDNGPEFTARAVREWLGWIGVRTLIIEPGSPWESGYVESFIGKLRDELLNGEIFDALLEATVVIEDWRREYNQCRPHSALG